ncbi:unnamed protein product [Amoebophrya sp. A120]|nr:unnamed protein product [Amoebophrya sp. A120]|eukprot:GSA120T00017246001.1
MQCAEKQQALRAECMICRAEFASITALSEHLLLASAETQVRKPPLIFGVNSFLDSVHWISPLEIRFTHDSVRAVFRPFEAKIREPGTVGACTNAVAGRDEEITSAKATRAPSLTMGESAGVLAANNKHQPKRKTIFREHWSILDSATELIQRKTASTSQVPPELELLEVCWHEDQLYLAGTGNRRLTMWRMLVVLRPGEWQKIKVKVVDKADPAVKFEQKLTTKCAGLWIDVRGCGVVGRRLEEGAAEEPNAVGTRSLPGEAAVMYTDPGIQWQQAIDVILQRGGSAVEVAAIAAHADGRDEQEQHVEENKSASPSRLLGRSATSPASTSPDDHVVVDASSDDASTGKFDDVASE